MSKSVIQPCPCCGGKARLKQAKYNVLGSYGDAELDKHWYGMEQEFIAIILTQKVVPYPKRSLR